MYIKVIRRQFFFICYHTQKVLSIDTKVNVWVWNKKSGRNVLVNVSCCQIRSSGGNFKANFGDFVLFYYYGKLI